MRFHHGLVLPVLAFALAGCSYFGGSKAEDTQMSTAAPINSSCPVEGSDVNPDAGTYEVGTYTVGFCCKGCAKKFDGWSEEERTAYVQEQVSEAGK
jgi:hypothetical protein